MTEESGSKSPPPESAPPPEVSAAVQGDEKGEGKGDGKGEGEDESEGKRGEVSYESGKKRRAQRQKQLKGVSNRISATRAQVLEKLLLSKKVLKPRPVPEKDDEGKGKRKSKGTRMSLQQRFGMKPLPERRLHEGKWWEKRLSLQQEDEESAAGEGEAEEAAATDGGKDAIDGAAANPIYVGNDDSSASADEEDTDGVEEEEEPPADGKEVHQSIDKGSSCEKSDAELDTATTATEDDSCSKVETIGRSVNSASVEAQDEGEDVCCRPFHCDHGLGQWVRSAFSAAARDKVEWQGGGGASDESDKPSSAYPLQ